MKLKDIYTLNLNIFINFRTIFAWTEAIIFFPSYTQLSFFSVRNLVISSWSNSTFIMIYRIEIGLNRRKIFSELTAFIEKINQIRVNIIFIFIKLKTKHVSKLSKSEYIICQKLKLVSLWHWSPLHNYIFLKLDNFFLSNSFRLNWATLQLRKTFDFSLNCDFVCAHTVTFSLFNKHYFHFWDLI